MRIGKLSSKGDAAVLDAPEVGRVQRSAVPRRVSGAPSLRRDLAEDFEAPDDSEGFVRTRRNGGLRLTLRGGFPRSVAGRVIAGVSVVAALALCVATMLGVRRYLLRNDRFVIQASSSVQITGNSHLTRPQLLSIFGEDVDRNILTVSLAERRAELERLPWVEHATVMRLLPDKLRVSIVERTPVAFVRQGGHIGLVDKSGVLLEMGVDDPDAGQHEHYSFPVVTGVSSDDPLTTRAARMKLYGSFRADLDSAGTKISDKLSEVDVSNPEDVKALIPSGSADILVHFGDRDFLDRYRKFEENLPKWKTDYPKLASADMRYERQVVLEMQPGSAVPVSQAPGATVAANETPAKPSAKPADKPFAVSKAKASVKPGAKKPGKPVVAAAKPAVPHAPVAHLTTAFEAHPSAGKAGPQ
jgi:cell division protein FtsQ